MNTNNQKDYYPWLVFIFELILLFLQVIYSFHFVGEGASKAWISGDSFAFYDVMICWVLGGVGLVFAFVARDNLPGQIRKIAIRILIIFSVLILMLPFISYFIK